MPIELNVHESILPHQITLPCRREKRPIFYRTEMFFVIPEETSKSISSSVSNPLCSYVRLLKYLFCSSIARRLVVYCEQLKYDG